MKYRKIGTVSIVFVSLLFVYARMNTAFQQPRIVIIGAGCAGSVTAWELHKQGFTHVDVYEARARVGGRTFSIELVDDTGEHVGYPDLGGENILDGGNAEYTCALIKELGLEYIEGVVPKSRLVFDDLGQQCDPQDIVRNKYGFTPETLWQTLQTLRSVCVSMEEVLQQLFPDDQFLQSHFALRLQGYEGGSVDRLSSHYVTTLYYQLLGAVCSVHADTSSIEYLMIQGGSNRITQCIAERLGDCVHLNSVLQKIEHNSDGYRLYFAHGLCVHADIVVLAIPASVYDSINIAPDIIPTDQLTAIKKIEYGQHAKMVIPIIAKKVEYSLSAPYMFALAGRQGDYAVLFYPTEYGYFTTHTIQDAFKRDFPWIEKWYVLPPLRDPVVAEDCYLKQYNCPVGYSWHHDPYARGTYSYIAVGQEEVLLATCEYKGQQYRKLFLPCNHDTLLFAGEHTTRLVDVLGTIEAAVESGIFTAQVIENLYKQRQNKIIEGTL